MKLKINIRREVKIAIVFVAVFALIAFAERMEGDVVIRNIEIRIENLHENHFLDKDDVMKLMQVESENIAGASLGKVRFKEIEDRIRRDPFVKDAELYSDLKGNLTVKAELRRPIARMMRNDGPDGYIAEDGTIMPVSEKFTSRVVLVTGPYVRTFLRQKNMLDTPEGTKIMELISTINEHEFWRAQISELDIDGDMRVTFVPQIGDEKIEFGKPENMEIKFSKLMIFYKEIIPRVGWNKYDRVNLEYEGQIVAE